MIRGSFAAFVHCALAGHGVQSVGITTNFNLEEAFELGQLSVYQLIEQLPDVEVTLEKQLDGNPLLYHLATNGTASNTLVARAAVKCIVGLSIFAVPAFNGALRIFDYEERAN